MSHPAIGVAAMPGAPIGSFVVNLAPALAPVGMALLVLAVLGAIVLLVGRDAHHPAAPGCRRAEVAGGERPSSSASRPGAGLIARSSSTGALWHGPVRPARHPPAMPRGLPKAIGPRAAPSEVLVSSTVKDLVAGSDLRFVDRGTHTSTAWPGEWRFSRVEGWTARTQAAEPGSGQTPPRPGTLNRQPDAP